MDNPLALLVMMWHARRPSLTADMPAVRNSFWLRRGYEGLTFFGTIVTATTEEALRMNSTWSALKQHEMIHLRQAQNTGDSWWRFYLLYLWYWLGALPLNFKMKNAAYILNPFELEAYGHMYEKDYLARCAEGAAEWRMWARMTPCERLEWYRKKGRL